MFDINKLTKKEYIPASGPSKLGGFQKQKKLVSLLLVTFKAFLIELGYWFMNLVHPKSPANISKQLALVTGGGNGLGRAFCFRLAKEGCDIAVVDIDFKNAQKTASEVEKEFGIKSRAYQCDISNLAAIVELKSQIESEMKAVDILVNNAGLLYMSNFVTSDVKDIQRVVDVNLTSQIMVGDFLCRKKPLFLWKNLIF